MDVNHIPFHGRDIARIGFGCWQLAGDYNLNGRPNGYGIIDPKESAKAIALALDYGINFFDTAFSYGFGRSEEVLGSAIKSYQGASPLVCTKYGMVIGGNGDDEDFSAGNLQKSVEGSLKRLQADCLGIILLHNPPDNLDFSTFDTAPFERLVQAGKILAYGVSCRTQKGVANVAKSGFGSVIEAVYNPLDRRYEQFFNDTLYKDKYTFICRVPFASGFISPLTLAGDRVFPANDIRHNFSGEQVAWVSDAVRKLSFLNDLEGGIVVSALRFQLSNAQNTLAIPGLKNSRQVEDAIMAMRLGSLPGDVMNKITEAVPEVFYRWRS
jgi:aryl-alcohol dehydrogenase-like predicted oxidoreductase